MAKQIRYLVLPYCDLVTRFVSHQSIFSILAHRSKQYDTVDIYALFDIPMPKLLTSDSLVAVWVTNRPKYKQFLIDKLFPAWQLERVGEWYWMKMTTMGDPVMPLDSMHRKPYELLLVAKCKGSAASDIPEKLVFASVVSQHSRKPPLNGKTPDPPFSIQWMRLLGLTGLPFCG